MIKRIITLVLIIGSFSFKNTTAQSVSSFTGKPQYQIIVKRAGVFLGNINVELFPLIAPNHVKNFDSLVSTQFFDSTAFHRVIPGFMIQGGDPNSRHGPISTWGYGDPGQPTVNAEFSAASHLRGRLSAARDTDVNSANSQFFICVANSTFLNGQYSVYGQVTSGMNIVDTIVKSPRDANDNPFQKIEMFVSYTGSNDNIPNMPTLNSPATGTQSVPANKQLKWNAVTDAVIYRLEVSTDSLFSTFFVSKDVAGTANTVVNLAGSTKYYWRVKANNGGQYSAYSTVWSFSTVFPSGINNLSFEEQGYMLEQNIPNPACNQTTIKYAIPNREIVSLKLLDITGREIITLVNEEKNKGEHQIILDLNKYSAGIYFYKIQAGNFLYTRKLILEKE